MTASFVYAAARTPFGRFGGALAEVRPDDLAAVALAGVLDKAPGLDRSSVGAIAIGHPLGASGARIVGTLAKRLQESGDRWGVAAICIGVGQALAVVLENVQADAST